MTLDSIFEIVRLLFVRFIQWLSSCEIFGFSLLQIIGISILLGFVVLLIKMFVK